MSSTPAAGNEPPSYRGYRYPVEIISHAVWLYFRFHLSLRDVEELLAERGVTVTYETIRAWCSSSARAMPQDCAGAAHGRVTNGTWMRCSSDPGQASLAVACGRQARRRPRCPGAAATRSACCRNLPSASHRVDGQRTAGGDHRQTLKLPARPAARAAERRPSSAQRPQQPSREFPSADSPR